MEREQSLMFAESEELLFGAKGVRAPPLDADGNVHFLVGAKVEAKLDWSIRLTIGCAAASVDAEKYKVGVSGGDGAVEVGLGM